MGPGLDTSFLGKEQRKTVALAIFCGVCAFGGWLAHDIFGAQASANQEKRLERIERKVTSIQIDVAVVKSRLGIPPRASVEVGE